jgi:hypothetical protein
MAHVFPELEESIWLTIIAASVVRTMPRSRKKIVYIGPDDELPELPQRRSQM